MLKNGEGLMNSKKEIENRIIKLVEYCYLQKFSENYFEDEDYQKRLKSIKGEVRRLLRVLSKK